jgi:hypothetical protein
MKRGIWLLLGFVFLSTSSIAQADGWGFFQVGLNHKAKRELAHVGVNKYLGEFTPAASTDVGEGWTKHTFDPLQPNGPLCILGTEYSVFTKIRNPNKLIIYMQGGGACWEGFYFCNLLAEEQEPQNFPQIGIFADSFSPESLLQKNPLGDYSIVYMPYCDGSVFSGDNDVADSNFPVGVRFHRGLANASAGVDVAKAVFPHARKIFLSGSSAGGVGAASFAPFLVRMAFGNWRQLFVFNDAGPVAANLNETESIAARAADWRFGQFYPASCTDCDDQGQQTALIKWRLDNDRTIRESFYSTDGDETDRFFLNVPTQEAYRDLILTEHGALNAAHPRRYKSFIRSGDDSHTALASPTKPFLFYLGRANGVLLSEWTGDFLTPLRCAILDWRARWRGGPTCVWDDIVEDFVPLP